MKKLALLFSLLILAVVLIQATAPGYSFTIDSEVRAYRGFYKVEKGIPYIVEGKEKYRLLLAPKAALDSMGVVLIEGDSLYAEAAPTKNGILVTKLITGEDSENIWSLRTYDLNFNFYDEPSTVKVNTKGCIGCKLCISACPVDAISMENGKAFIDTVKCVDCGICINGNGKYKGCPVRAIGK